VHPLSRIPTNLALTATALPDGSAPESVELLDGGAEAYPRMLAAIDQARQTTHLEVYIFEQDGWGERFIAALGAAAHRGVAVTVVVDGFGTLFGGRRLVRRLREAGCTARIYHPLSGFFRGERRRNHRKILVVDDRVAFLGGINIGDTYATAGERLGWADLALEVRGRAAAWLGRRMRGAGALPPLGAVRIHLSSGRRLRQRYVALLREARDHVWLAHAYFLPDVGLLRALRRATRRGVRVTLLLAGQSDVVLAQMATMRLYRQLLAAGVQIHEWRASVLHAKAAVADGQRMLLGSFNLDPLSLVNMESLVEVNDPGAAAQLEAWIDQRLAHSRQVTPEDCFRSPLQRFLVDVLGSWAARFTEWLARTLAGHELRRRRLRAALVLPQKP
jgi:cardiolipin synthase